MKLNSIRTKTILGIAFIEVILLVILISSILKFIEQTNVDALHEYETTTSKLFVTTTKDAILSYDLASLESHANELNKNKTILYVVIKDASNNILVEAGDITKLTESTNESSTIHRRSYDVEESSNVFGKIYLGFDTARIDELQHQAFKITTTIASLEIILVAIFSWFLGKYLTKDLFSLNQVAKKISSGDLTSLVDVKSKDEIGDLSESFNKMVLSLRETKLQRDKYEDELQSLNKALEDKVESRTKELIDKNAELSLINEKLSSAQSQLIQSEKLASIGQLAAGVAHEINNPIGFVTGNVAVLDEYIVLYKTLLELLVKLFENNDKEENKKILQKIHTLVSDEDVHFVIEDIEKLMPSTKDGLERIKKIVNNLRSFSRVDSESDVEEADLNACIESTLSMVNNEVKYHCNIETSLMSLPAIKINAGQINQVILNLVLNAAQAIEENGEIQLKTHHDDKFAYLEVKDNGCGIPQKVIQKIFDPFFTTKAVGEGTGLGLSISYGIIKDHGGELLVNSIEGVGSTFVMSLPL